MKFILHLLLIILVVQIDIANCIAKEMSTDEAVHILQTTKPMLSPLVALGLVDLEKRKLAEQLYDEQIGAIAVLAKAKLPNTANLLIPYLNYPIKTYSSVLIRPYRDSQIEDVKVTRNNWPAFSALFEIPGSAQVLEDYALDPKNSSRYRIATFVALRYLDLERFKMVASQFDKEFTHVGPNTRNYLNAIENGHAIFHGAYHIDITQ